ncbi:hypothetical protein [Nocardioides sp.]|uniref:hypothetical protein n=1 Tax=Nocardioides sp. TaxID=35761 RepID=UPI002727218E|nr:hypothetical protein [Nocardioides sp.]MDO9456150.1 hypothetical protein [Nocardioides sp.]
MKALEAVRAVRGWHPSQQALRLVVLLGPLVALLAAAPAGHGPAPWIVGVVLLLSVLWAARPESGGGTLALLLVLFWWTRVPDDALHPAVLVAAVAVVLSHLAAVVSAAAPPRTPVDPAVLRLWMLRGAAVLLAAPVVWVLARALRDQAAPDLLWPAALLAALLVVVALGLVLERREEAP